MTRCAVLCVSCRAVCRQQRELADVELSRLSAEVQAAAAAAADAQGLLAAAEATARKEVESARHALLKVWSHLRNSQHILCVQPLRFSMFACLEPNTWPQLLLA